MGCLLVNALLCKRWEGLYWRVVVQPANNSTPFQLPSRASRLRCLLHQLAKSSQRVDLDRIGITDHVFAQSLPSGEHFLRGSQVSNDLVLWDGHGNRQTLPGVVEGFDHAIPENRGAECGACTLLLHAVISPSTISTAQRSPPKPRLKKPIESSFPCRSIHPSS